jgi:alkylation response protein AidB-like acyl-CoA dehydrogenase
MAQRGLRRTKARRQFMQDIRPDADTSNIPDSRGINFFKKDPSFGALLKSYLGETVYRGIEEQLVDLGQRASDELDAWATNADHHPPELRQRTRRGEALQHIDKHPDYVALERVAYAELGLAAMSHRENAPPPLVKYALTYLFVQAEFGLCCPVSMTDSLTRTLRRFGTNALIERYLPMLASQDFDTLYQGAMFMTEQAAGSDVGRIATRATRSVDAHGNEVWTLTGDKWFCSNADADLAMVLARPDDAPDGINGLALFLLPKTREDGTHNAYRIVRLKDKLGSRSMARGGAHASRVDRSAARRAKSRGVRPQAHRHAAHAAPVAQADASRGTGALDVHADRDAARARGSRRCARGEVRAHPHAAHQVPRMSRCAPRDG